MKVTNRLQDAVSERTNGSREGIESTAREELDRRTESVREEFARRKGETRAELGERLFDLGEEYFPEEASRRRRKYASAGFVVGLAAGFIARHLLD